MDIEKETGSAGKRGKCGSNSRILRMCSLAEESPSAGESLGGEEVRRAMLACTLKCITGTCGTKGT